MAQARAREDKLEEDLYDFLMDIDVAIGESLPKMTLQVVQAKLSGEYVSTSTNSTIACNLQGKPGTSKLLASML
jgi:hypothetical protein